MMSRLRVKFALLLHSVLSFIDHVILSQSQRFILPMTLSNSLQQPIRGSFNKVKDELYLNDVIKDDEDLYECDVTLELKMDGA